MQDIVGIVGVWFLAARTHNVTHGRLLDYDETIFFFWRAVFARARRVLPRHVYSRCCAISRGFSTEPMSCRLKMRTKLVVTLSVWRYQLSATIIADMILDSLQ